MAEGYQQGPTDHTNIYQVQNAAKLTEVPRRSNVETTAPQNTLRQAATVAVDHRLR